MAFDFIINYGKKTHKPSTFAFSNNFIMKVTFTNVN